MIISKRCLSMDMKYNINDSKFNLFKLLKLFLTLNTLLNCI